MTAGFLPTSPSWSCHRDPSATDAPNDPLDATSSSRLPPPGNVRFSPCSTHLALSSILGPPTRGLSSCPDPLPDCNAYSLQQGSCHRGPYSLLSPQPHGAAQDVHAVMTLGCTPPPTRASSLTQTRLAHPFQQAFTQDGKCWGEGGELKRQKFRGAGSHTSQR